MGASRVHLPSGYRKDRIAYYDRDMKSQKEREALAARHLAILKEKTRLVPGITVDEEIMGGDPVVSDSRIPVYNIVSHLAEGYTVEKIAAECYPELTVEQIKRAIEYAAVVTTLDDFADLTEDD